MTVRVKVDIPGFAQEGTAWAMQVGPGLDPEGIVERRYAALLKLALDLGSWPPRVEEIDLPYIWVHGRDGSQTLVAVFPDGHPALKAGYLNARSLAQRARVPRNPPGPYSPPVPPNHHPRG